MGAGIDPPDLPLLIDEYLVSTGSVCVIVVGEVRQGTGLESSTFQRNGKGPTDGSLFLFERSA